MLQKKENYNEIQDMTLTKKANQSNEEITISKIKKIQLKQNKIMTTQLAHLLYYQPISQSVIVNHNMKTTFIIAHLVHKKNQLKTNYKIPKQHRERNTNNSINSKITH